MQLVCNLILSNSDFRCFIIAITLNFKSYGNKKGAFIADHKFIFFKIHFCFDGIEIITRIMLRITFHIYSY